MVHKMDEDVSFHNRVPESVLSKIEDKQTEKVKIHNTKIHYLMNAQKYFSQLGT